MTDYQPTIPNKVRDAAYIGGLIVSAVVGIAVATVSTLAPDAAAGASTIGTSILTGAGIIVSGLGVAYRPGKQQIND